MQCQEEEMEVGQHEGEDLLESEAEKRLLCVEYPGVVVRQVLLSVIFSF
jgi:hypothetical protein